MFARDIAHQYPLRSWLCQWRAGRARRPPFRAVWVFAVARNLERSHTRSDGTPRAEHHERSSLCWRRLRISTGACAPRASSLGLRWARWLPRTRESASCWRAEPADEPAWRIARIWPLASGAGLASVTGPWQLATTAAGHSSSRHGARPTWARRAVQWPSAPWTQQFAALPRAPRAGFEPAAYSLGGHRRVETAGKDEHICPAPERLAVIWRCRENPLVPILVYPFRTVAGRAQPQKMPVGSASTTASGDSTSCLGERRRIGASAYRCRSSEQTMFPPTPHRRVNAYPRRSAEAVRPVAFGGKSPGGRAGNTPGGGPARPT
jgi:hypothetical protein